MFEGVIMIDRSYGDQTSVAVLMPVVPQAGDRVVLSDSSIVRIKPTPREFLMVDDSDSVGVDKFLQFIVYAEYVLAPLSKII